MFFWQDRQAAGESILERCFTDTTGGVSEAPFSSFNLARHVGDLEAHVEVNRQRLGAALASGNSPVPIRWMNQVHGTDVVEVSRATNELVTADAMVTRDADLALAVMVADCTPVLFSGDDAGVIAVAHAGRPGMMQGIAGQTVRAMRDLGAKNIKATLGPSVCGRCYEVPRPLQQEAAEVCAESAAITWHGTPAIDVAAGVASQLVQLGVKIEWVPGCTRESSRLFSYRRDHETGRFAGVIVRHSAV